MEVLENIFLVFVKVIVVGAEYIEIDVYVSYDGVAVVAYDVDLLCVVG